jgi:hypothetical protein
MNIRMRRTTILLPFLAVVTLAAEDVGKDTFQEQPRIELKAFSTTVALDGNLEFEVRLLNTSSEPLMLYSNMYQGMVFRAFNSEGTTLYPKGFTHDHSLCPPPPPRPYDFVQLTEGQFFGQNYVIAPANLGIESAGVYTIAASYWLRVGGDESDPQLSLTGQPVMSSPIRITVVSKKK